MLPDCIMPKLRVIPSVDENMEELVHELHSNVKDDVVNLLPDDGNIRAKFGDYFEALNILLPI